MATSQTYLDFDAELFAFFNYIITAQAAERLRVSEQQIEELGDFYSEWINQYYTYLSPERRTLAVIRKIRDLHKTGTRLLGELRRLIVANPSANILASDRVNLRIPERQLPHRIIAATDAPEHIFIRAAPRVVTLATINTITPGGDNRAMPKDQKCLRIEIAVLDDPEAQPTDSDFYRRITVNRMRFNLKFEQAEQGKIGFIRSAWETRSGKVGPVCRPFRFNIL